MDLTFSYTIIRRDSDADVEVTTQKEGPGRPRLVRTGSRGRPSKQYNIVHADVSEGSSNAEAQQNEGSASSKTNNTDENGWFDAFSGMCTAEIPFTRAITATMRSNGKASFMKKRSA